MDKNITLIAVILILLLSIAFMPSNEILAEESLNIAINVNPDSLDPANYSSIPSNMVFRHVIEPLFDFNQEGEVIPVLAKDYDISDDGGTYTIEIHEGINFHDGSYLDAEAVKMNLERFLAEQGPFAFMLNMIEDINIEDNYTIELNLEYPFAPFLEHLAVNSFIASPESLGNENINNSTNPVGTGPFEFSEWVEGEHIRLHANPDYWGSEPEINQLTFDIVPEDSTRSVMLETGEADAATNIPVQDVSRIEQIDEIEIKEIETPREIFVGFNLEKDPFDQQKVRQAINYAVDNDMIVEELLDGFGRASDSTVAEDVFGYSSQEPYNYDIEKATELMEKAGHEDGFETTLYYSSGRYMMDDIIVQAIQDQLAEINIDVNLENLEWATYLELINSPPEESEHEMYYLGWISYTRDADLSLFPFFHSEMWSPAGQNHAFFQNDRVDELLEQARVELDNAEREGIYSEINQEIWEEAPWIYLHSETTINAQREDVNDLIHHYLEYIDASNAYISD